MRSESLSFAERPPEIVASDPGQKNPAPPEANPDVITSAFIREDFDHQQFIDAEHIFNVRIDVNRGEVYLPSIVLPEDVGIEAPGAPVNHLGSYDRAEQSHSILIDDATTINGRDSIELEAYDWIRVTGSISADQGGISLTANNGIYIDGDLESSGPIRLRVTKPGGVILVTGKIRTRDMSDRPSASIHLHSRGEIQISESVRTGDAQNADSGEIEVVSYGSVTLNRNTAVLKTGNSADGNAGPISVSSESGLSLLDGARFEAGDTTSLGDQNRTLQGGHISLRILELDLADNTGLYAGHCEDCQGGNINIVAAQHIQVGQQARVKAGDGMLGGDTNLNFGSATIGRRSALIGGAGHEHAGRLYLDGSGRLRLRHKAQLIGGKGKCTNGGPVVGLIGEELAVTYGSMIKGGDSILDGDDCLAPSQGGDVQIFCRQTSGPTMAVINGGDGSQSGRSQLTVNSEYTRDDPVPHPNTVGHLDSRPFDRSTAGSGGAPILSLLQASLPSGTQAHVLLSGALQAEGPYGEWQAHDTQGRFPVALDAFRFFRYRVLLHGRSLDSPIMDRFEINLAPEN
jgi:hypothetical protein